MSDILDLSNDFIKGLNDDELKTKYLSHMKLFELSCLSSDFESSKLVFPFEVSADDSAKLHKIHIYIRQLLKAKLNQALMQRIGHTRRDSMAAITVMLSMYSDDNGTDANFSKLLQNALSIE